MTEKILTPAEVSQIPAASLAYLGDAVLEVLVRESLVRRNAKNPSVESLMYVTAPKQSDAVERILPHLTEEEDSVFKRGRNCVHSGVPKHATPAQYRRATGLETLFAFLHLTGRKQRAEELFEIGFSGKITEEI